MYGGKIAPVAGAILPPYIFVANFDNISGIKTIWQNPNKNSLPYRYFKIQNNIIEHLIEWKSNQLNSQ